MALAGDGTAGHGRGKRDGAAGRGLPSTRGGCRRSGRRARDGVEDDGCRRSGASRSVAGEVERAARADGVEDDGRRARTGEGDGGAGKFGSLAASLFSPRAKWGEEGAARQFK